MEDKITPGIDPGPDSPARGPPNNKDSDGAASDNLSPITPPVGKPEAMTSNDDVDVGANGVDAEPVDKMDITEPTPEHITDSPAASLDAVTSTVPAGEREARDLSGSQDDAATSNMDMDPPVNPTQGTAIASLATNFDGLRDVTGMPHRPLEHSPGVPTDIAKTIPGMYRILDLVSEQSSGGLGEFLDWCEST